MFGQWWQIQNYATPALWLSWGSDIIVYGDCRCTLDGFVQFLPIIETQDETSALANCALSGFEVAGPITQIETDTCPCSAILTAFVYIGPITETQAQGINPDIALTDFLRRTVVGERDFDPAPAANIALTSFIKT